jgi:hypothetical protein
LVAGSDVGAAIARAPAGSVICLSAGGYPQVNLTSTPDLNAAGPDIVVQPVAGQTASVAGMALELVHHVQFVGLSITAPVLVMQGDSYLDFERNDIGNSVQGFYFYGWDGYSIDHITVNANTIHDIQTTDANNIDSCTAGGGMGLCAIGNVTSFSITNNTFNNIGADYLSGAGNNFVVDHNTFSNSLKNQLTGTASTNDHQDLWQIYQSADGVTFTNNVARNTGTDESLLLQRSTAIKNVTIRNNLFDHSSNGYDVQIYPIQGLTFTYNTFIANGYGVLFRTADSSDPGATCSNYNVTHNILTTPTKSGSAISVQDPTCGTYDYNVTQDRSARGRNSIRRWRPRFADRTWYQPVCLRVAAGYRTSGAATLSQCGRRRKRK